MEVWGRSVSKKLGGADPPRPNVMTPLVVEQYLNVSSAPVHRFREG